MDKYAFMFHSGSLNDSLKTIIYVSEYDFKSQFKKFNYSYYCFDNRINAYRFIIDNMELNYNEPTWLLIFI